MSRVLNFIRDFCLFLAAGVFIAHMMIPHDHHSSSSEKCNQESLLSHASSHSHKPGFPAHCHAFNDLASEKAVSYFVVKQILSEDFLPGCSLSNETPYLALAWYDYACDITFPEANGAPAILSFRAPPALAWCLLLFPSLNSAGYTLFASDPIHQVNISF